MNVVMVAGGPWQMFLLRHLQRRGYTVHVVNPVRSETAAAADGHLQADVRDVESYAAAVAALRPLFVVSDQSDTASYYVSVLAERLALAGNPPEVVRTFVDKGRMYEFGTSIGLPVPPFAVVREAAEVRAFVREHGLPVIVKPVDATGSRGFARIDAEAEVAGALATCLAYSPSGRAIVQEFVRCDVEITVEGFCAQGRHRSLVSSSKSHFSPGIASSLLYPYSDGELLERIRQANDSFVNRSGLRFGLTHAEYMIDSASGRFWLTEIGARGAGCAIASEIVPWVTGVETYDLLCRCLLGEEVDVGRLEPRRDRWAIAQFYDRATMGGIGQETADRIRRVEGVHDFYFDFRRHDFLPSESGNRNSRHSLAIVRTGSRTALDEALGKIDEVLASDRARTDA